MFDITGCGNVIDQFREIGIAAGLIKNLFFFKAAGNRKNINRLFFLVKFNHCQVNKLIFLVVKIFGPENINNNINGLGIKH